MYALETVADTTWSSAATPKPPGGVDLHTSVVPIPTTELEGRGGSYVITCP
jgi:hypothetical protein